MKPYRGKQIDNGKEVKGWYCECDGKSYIANKLKDTHWDLCSVFAGFVEVDPKTVGQFVCTDKNGKDVFEKAPCLLHCFSPPKEVYPKWNQEYLRWELWKNGTAVMAAIEGTFKRHVELIEEKND